MRIALAGNPNSGKTSLFNALTGARQHVGNYPGVTVEKRWGRYDLGGERCDVVDLPGTYSLSSYSPEERITQRELLDRAFDVVVVVVDATALQRSLVLLVQLLQLGVNPVLCLNMADEAERGGQRLDLDALRARLGIRVVETVAHRGVGVDALRAAIADTARSPARVRPPSLGADVDDALAAIASRLPDCAVPRCQRTWAATRLLVDDEPFRAALPAVDDAVRAAAAQREHLLRATALDAAMCITERYYRFVADVLRDVTRSPRRADARAPSDRIDRVLAHRALGLPLFLAIMYAIFWLTFTVGELPMGWIEAGFEALAGTVDGLWAPDSDSMLRSLLVDGVIAGVGGVIVFLPNIVLLFLGLAFLEDTGYMARAAFLMDRFLHRFGLHGRSFIPMMTGFGCSIPGIMATRTLENERDRLATMLVLPLMSCGARLPIWMLLIPAFYPPAWRAPMLWMIYVIGVVLALALATVLRATVLRGRDAPFVMELPPYRLPTAGAVARKMTERSWLYLRKAGTVILSISIVMWVITAYPKKTSYDVDARIAAGEIQPLDDAELEAARAAEDLRHSVAGRIGAAMEPAIRPLGFDWKIGTALVGAFAAKEVFVAQMGIVYSMGESEEAASDLQATLRRDYSPLVGFSLMLFLLIATPCMATIAVTRRESGSWKWALLQLGGLTGVAYLVSLVVYQIGSL